MKTQSGRGKGYGAAEIAQSDKAAHLLAELQAQGFDHLAVWLAKIPLSISTDPAI